MSVLNIGLRSKARRVLPKNLLDSVRSQRGDALIVDWVNRGGVAENWGDRIAPALAAHISGRPIVNNRDVFNPSARSVYTTIGSMLGTVAGRHVEVWGTGFIDGSARLRCQPRVHAVRGPRTAEMLESQGVECPEVYGDPAWYAPEIFVASDAIAHETGLIPHWKERDLPAVREMAELGVHVIDICGGLDEVVRQVTSCRRVLSAALHGLVCADAYGVPAQPIRLSGRPAGDGFKLRDYLEGTDRADLAVLRFEPGSTKSALASIDWRPTPALKKDRFLAACPFAEPVSSLPAT